MSPLYQVNIQSSGQVFFTLGSGPGYLRCTTLAPMMPYLWADLEWKCPGTSEVVTALSSVALQPYVLVCDFSHSLFVSNAFEYWEGTPPIMADGRWGSSFDMVPFR